MQCLKGEHTGGLGTNIGSGANEERRPGWEGCCRRDIVNAGPGYCVMRRGVRRQDGTRSEV